MIDMEFEVASKILLTVLSAVLLLGVWFVRHTGISEHNPFFYRSQKGPMTLGKRLICSAGILAFVISLWCL